MKSTLLLLILDGWGISENTDPKYNALLQAHTPNWDKLLATSPHINISACGEDVGLPQGQMGNSEVGHITIGAGRAVYQDLSLINKAISSNKFFENTVLLNALDTSLDLNSKVHIMGLLSPGGVHSHEEHIYAMVKLAISKKVKFCVHAFLDGRDVPPKSAKASLNNLQELLSNTEDGCLASIMGRYYAMDRDQRVERTQAAVDLLTKSQAEFYYPDPFDALQSAYDRGETDEFVQPTIINKECAIDDNDVVIFMNFRADRARQLSYALTKPRNLGCYVSLTEYADDLESDIAFPKEELDNVLGDILEQQQLTQLRIAETEKYAHVTFFFNGGREKLFIGEDRVLVPSPKVTTYDLQPEMSAREVTNKLVSAINSKEYDVIICNYANADMVGHTGNMPAAIKAVNCIDECLGQIIECLEQNKGSALITADHGNIECMYNTEAEQPHTAHTHNLVPLVYFGPQKVKFNKEIKSVSLQDIAPTLLFLLNINPPKEMTGKNLLHAD